MAGRKKIEENEEIKENKTASKGSKKVSTGSTKKMVQKRSSSVAAKKTVPTEKENIVSTTTKKKTTTKKTTSKETTTKKTAAKKDEKTSETPKKKTTKKTQTASKTKKENTNKIDELEEQKKENFDSNIELEKQDEKPPIEREKIKKIFKEDEKEDFNTRYERIKKSKRNGKNSTLKEMSEVERAVKKEMKSNRTLPEVELRRMTNRIFKNLLLAIIVMIYFNFIVLGFVNIENEVFLTDLKVFSGVLIIISLGTIEFAYKKKSGKSAIHGIEFLVLALITIGLIYVNLTWKDRFIPITVLATYLFAMYYIAKDIIIYKKMKKKYFIESMKEIIRR